MTEEDALALADLLDQLDDATDVIHSLCDIGEKLATALEDVVDEHDDDYSTSIANARVVLELCEVPLRVLTPERVIERRLVRKKRKTA